MYDVMRISSYLRDYTVHFEEDVKATLDNYDFAATHFIIDQNIADLYGALLSDVLSKRSCLIIKATEENKSVNKIRFYLTPLLNRKVRRDHKLVAIGGGIIQDITCFIATILFRGVEWDFFPTTLLAQADSCIGSKSSINVGVFKNQLGTFYPPSNVYIALRFLKTLEDKDIKSGIGEILHFYFIAGSEQTISLYDDYDRLLEDRKLLQKYIRTSLEIKKSVIEIDELDRNERNLFNYGHTFGHAIEAVSRYGVPHGQAVTMGMDIANYISLEFGYLNKETFESMHQILFKNMPAFELKAEQIDDYFKALSKDKKNIGGKLGCILTSGPGKMKKELCLIDDRLKKIILSYFRSSVRSAY